MKLALSVLICLLCSNLIFAQGPKIRIYLGDGSDKVYLINDIDKLNIATGKNVSMLKIYYQSNLVENYLSKDIEFCKFDFDSKNNQIFSVKVSGKTHDFRLSEIDSINFFIPETPIPEITNINPSSCKVGDEITITGKNFGAQQNTSIVSFNSSNAIIYTLWSDTQIKVKVPAGVKSGLLSVTVDKIKSNEVDYKIISYLISISPATLKLGDVMTIKGMSLGASQGTNSILFNNNPAIDYVSWTDTLVKVKVPLSARTGKVSAMIDGSQTNELDYTIQMSITNLSPKNVNIGDTIVISGISLGAKKDSSIVTFGTINAKDYISWSDSMIKVKVPLNTKSGKLNVTVKKIKSNDLDYYLIPHINQLIPDTAGVSQNISIIGYGFGDKQGNSLVQFNGAAGTEYSIWNENEIRLAVPEGALDGPVNVNVAGSSSNNSKIIIKPYITSVTPTALKIGEELTISGYNFGTTQGNSFISFANANASIYTSWSDKEIKVKIPDGANSGKLSVTVGNRKSNEPVISLIPVLTAINPVTEKIGASVTISGNGFNNARGSSVVSFNNVDATNYTSWSNNSITVIIPSGAKTGKVTVTASGQKSNELDFSILPSIAGITPSNGLIGDQVVISGASFGDTRGNNYVSFNGVAVTNYINWSESSITVTVPQGTTSGKVYVMIGTIKSNEVDFTLTPQLTSVTPDKANLGTQITLTGINFGDTRGTNFVSFNTYNATSYQSWTNTSIIVTVPNSALSGKISVTINGVKSNELDFTVTSIMIGNQEWTTRNLDVTTYRNGDAIPECTDNTQWNSLTTGAWCYYSNDSQNGTTYGKLYNWYAVNDSRGLAPSGWHVPTDNEWSTLTSYLGGEGVAGGKMKEIGTSHWTSPNTGADNTSGFTGLGAGYRYSGGFNRILDAGIFWSATQNDVDTAIPRTLFYNSAGVTKPANSKTMGMSIRLVKD